MATLVLRPVSNVQNQHQGNGYSAINEAVADDDSTYISQQISSTSQASVTSRYSLESLSGNKVITSAKVVIRAKKTSSNDNAYLTASVISGSQTSDMSQKTLTTSYANYEQVLSNNLVSWLNSELSSGRSPSIDVSVTTSGYKAQSKNSNFQARVTQAYVEVTYEEESGEASTLYLKVNGQYVPVSKAYRKQGYYWEEITDLETLFDVNTKYEKRE